VAEPDCPICKKPMAAKFRPFCSQRCADVDLGRWFSEDYRIPASPPDPQGSDDDNLMG
jgi:hypothetical protein